MIKNNMMFSEKFNFLKKEIRKKEQRKLKQQISEEIKLVRPIEIFYESIAGIKKFKLEYDDDHISEMQKSIWGEDVVFLESACSLKFDNPSSEWHEIDLQKLSIEKNEDNLGKIKFIFEQLQIKEEENAAIVSNNPYVSKLIQRANNRKREYRRERIQNLNLIVLSLASSFEILISNLLKYNLLHVYRGGAYISKLNRNFNELKEFKNIEEIKANYVEKYVSDLIYKDFEEWISTSGNILANNDLKGREFKQTISSIKELFKRRNLIVHNNNIVNDIYKNATGKGEKNKELSINKKYIINQISELTYLATFLISENLKSKKLYKRKFTWNRMNELCLILMGNEEFSTCRELLNVIKLSSNDEIDTNTLIALNNIWLSHFFEGSKEIVKEEISIFLTEYGQLEAVKTLQISMAISILLEEDNAVAKCIEFVEQIEKKTEQINVLEWPIFDILKEKEEFIELKNRIYYN